MSQLISRDDLISLCGSSHPDCGGIDSLRGYTLPHSLRWLVTFGSYVDAIPGLALTCTYPMNRGIPLDLPNGSRGCCIDYPGGLRFLDPAGDEKARLVWFAGIDLVIR